MGSHAPVKAFLLAAAVALAAAGCGTSSESKRNGEFTDDAALSAKVKSAIATDVGARAAGAVNVEIYKGVVSLTGFVDSQDTAKRAASAAQKVGGVRSVKNDVRVKSAATGG
jgi:osmotically-inducible protein OsmY